MITKLINLKDIIHIRGIHIRGIQDIIYSYVKKPDKTYYSNTSILFKHLHHIAHRTNGKFLIRDAMDHNHIVFPSKYQIYYYNMFENNIDVKIY